MLVKCAAGLSVLFGFFVIAKILRKRALERKPLFQLGTSVPARLIGFIFICSGIFILASEFRSRSKSLGESALTCLMYLTIGIFGLLQDDAGKMTESNRTMQLRFLVLFPWAMAALFLAISPGTIVPVIKSNVGIFTIVGMAIWQILGVKITQKFISADDPRARIKFMVPMVVFFFPVVLAVIIGPIVFNVLHSRP